MGSIDQVLLATADSDGDGMDDDVDKCPNSNTSTTLIVDGTDSGIPNTLQLDGCTLADLLGEDASPSDVAHLTNSLRKNGELSGRDKGRIQSSTSKR